LAGAEEAQRPGATTGGGEGRAIVTRAATAPLRLEPVTLTEAKRFVWEHHRHNRAPIGWRFGVGLSDGERLIGVAIASYPGARELHDGQTIEVLRCCTDGTRNACTRLYGAIHRAAAALGYRVAITYTLASEPGSSVKAVGYVMDAELPARGWGGGRHRYESNLLGEIQRPEEAKIRWRKELV